MMVMMMLMMRMMMRWRRRRVLEELFLLQLARIDDKSMKKKKFSIPFRPIRLAPSPTTLKTLPISSEEPVSYNELLPVQSF